MTWAYVHPTSLPTSYPLRSRGAKQFRLLFIFHILSALVLGGVNLIILYAAFAHDKRRRKTWLRNVLCNCHMAAPIRTAGAVLGLAVVGFYPLIIAAFVREPAARFAFGNACRGFELMAEIEVLDDFPRYGTVLADASSTIKFFKRGAFQYTMDLDLKFDSDIITTINPGWSMWNNGSFELKLRSDPGKGGEPVYFNVSQLITDQLHGTNYTGIIPGSVASIKYELLPTAKYLITFTNTTAPGFPATIMEGNFTTSPMKLSFPELRLQQPSSDHPWRFLDRVCLPPRVSLRDQFQAVEDVYGDMSSDCRKFR
ncbi:hypothetical protein EX30DRAFT_364852 [Ascodesmis nigricans]|uniref:Uncharacterized protein n=1 Tax=Ascodesmis nigricans TaxID=341454 RepID=A0A4S2MU91_9PEZI|nr:hypothetical protein EX30DRAFT_364852 [Ascodesmis nigricans]